MSDRLILAIENSNPSSQSSFGDGPGVAVGRTGGSGIELLASEPLRTVGRHDDDLIPAIDRLFRMARSKPDQISRIAVSIGPGGYTALRTSIAAAEMIAEATGAHIAAIPSAQVAARLAFNQTSSARFAVALASKAQSSFITVFDESRRAVSDGKMTSASELAAMGIRVLIADQFLPSEFRSVSSDLGIRIVPLRLNAAACLEASASLPDVESGVLAPLYGREPEAVTLWRARRS